MAEITFGTLTVKPFLDGFGAEVSGIDWSIVPLDDKTIQTLVDIQNKFAVTVFRNTGLDDERHIAFSKQLGIKLEENPVWYGKSAERLSSVYLFDVGNIEADGTLVKVGSRRWAHSKGNALRHTDSAFHQHRAKYSLLLAHEVPESGKGDTQFADTRRAYADLPQDMKSKLKDLIVEHDLWHSRKLGAPEIYSTITEHERISKPPAYHKLVQTAPDGRETLYIAAHAKNILGYSHEESQTLIWELIEHCTQPKYVFSFSWLSAGDMAWWDNRQSMHRATEFAVDMEKRDVRRTTIFDDGPFCHGVPPEERITAGWIPLPN